MSEHEIYIDHEMTEEEWNELGKRLQETGGTAILWSGSSDNVSSDSESAGVRKKGKLCPSFKRFVGSKTRASFTLYKVYHKSITRKKRTFFLTLKFLLFMVYLILLPFIVLRNLLVS